MGDYVGDMTPQAKNGKKGPAGPARQRGEIWRSNLGYFLFFYRISCPPLETTFWHWSTPFLCQMMCFGGDWFP